MLKGDVVSSLDPLRFAYRQGTEFAVASVTHLISKHLENPKTSAWVLFEEFSSAFITIQPYLLVQMLNDMHVNPCIVKGFYWFSINRTQHVKVNSSLSSVRYCSTGVPQGCVSSPFLYTLYTNECRSIRPNNPIIQCSDDTVILSLLHRDDCPAMYLDEIDTFKDWCDSHHLIKKTKEMILDPREVGHTAGL